MRNLSSKRIGWVIGKDPEIPAVRWRFGAYARLRGITPLEATATGEYDLVWLSQIADYTMWAKYPRSRTKLIVDLCDDYLSEPAFTAKDIARELGKYVFGQHAKRRLSFRRVVEDMCRRADAVVVGSDAQLDHVKPLCTNVVRILDIHTDSLGWRKTDYRASDTFHICWEGYPALEGLSMVLPALRRVAAKYKLCLHFVTNGKRYRLRNHFPRDVRQLLAGLCNGMQWYMYDWNSFMTSRILTACDLAIIPLARNDRFSSGKGANKLLFFWQLGIPVVTSAIQSYMDEMHACGTLAYCHNEQQWYAMIERYISSEGDRRNAAEQAARYVDEKYSDQCLVEQWDRLVGQLLR